VSPLLRRRSAPVPPEVTKWVASQTKRHRPRWQRMALWLLRRAALAAVTGVSLLAVAAARGTVRWPRAAAVAWISLWWAAARLLPLPWWSGVLVVLALVVLVAVLEHRRRPRSVVEVPTVDWRVAKWRELADGSTVRTRVLPSGETVTEEVRGAGFLPGSQVDDRVENLINDDGRVIGFRLRVTGGTARQHADIIEAARAPIAAMFGTVPDGVRVVVEGDYSWCWLDVLSWAWLQECADRAAALEAERQDRLREVHRWDGQTLAADGTIEVGVGVDGQPMRLTLFVPGQGARHTWIVGSSRVGKSGSVTQAIAGAVRSGLVRLHLIDLNGGVSLTEWNDLAASYAETPEQAKALLRWLDAMMDEKVAQMKARGLKVFPAPTVEEPLDLIVMDEAQDLARDVEAMEIVDRIARKSLKVLIAIWWMTQVALADRAFGNAGTALREQFQAGNVWAFYAGKTTTSLAVSDTRVLDLTQLPKGVPGASVVDGPAHEVPPLGRARWIPDDEALDVARACAGEGYPVAEQVTGADLLEQAKTRRPVAVVPPPQADDDGPTGWGPAKQRVLVLVAGMQPGEQFTTGAVIAELGDVSRQTVGTALRALADDPKTGQPIEDKGFGKWMRRTLPLDVEFDAAHQGQVSALDTDMSTDGRKAS
jgi:hypothetical protein